MNWYSGYLKIVWKVEGPDMNQGPMSFEAAGKFVEDNLDKLKEAIYFPSPCQMM